jgi:cobyrinic acid a,c-diamide synthase
MIAAPRSGSGKTTLTLGLLRAFRRRGVAAVGLKSGPDYIDPAFHAAASGGAGVNLDSWAMEPELLTALACDAAAGRALALCEASMGLFDGVPATHGRSGASADVAAALGMPVLLILDISGQAQSAAAVVKGCATYDPRLKVAAVVVNRVGSERHRRLVVEAIEALGIPVIGALPRDETIVLPERHLGLVQAGETAALDARIERIADFVEAHVDCDRVSALAADLDLAQNGRRAALRPPGQRIALASDEAFSFIYPHLLRGWRAAGAEVVAFSPLADEPPPMDCDVCWLPGGYPELHTGRLAAAERFRAGLSRFAATKPVHGECGGYMALGVRLVDASGVSHRMAGLLGVETTFAKRRMTLGYREAHLAADCALGPAGAVLRGHEFHYATIAAQGDDEPFALATDAYGAPPAPAGSRRGRVTGSFFHVIAEADNASKRRVTTKFSRTKVNYLKPIIPRASPSAASSALGSSSQ